MDSAEPQPKGGWRKKLESAREKLAQRRKAEAEAEAAAAAKKVGKIRGPLLPEGYTPKAKKSTATRRRKSMELFVVVLLKKVTCMKGLPKEMLRTIARECDIRTFRRDTFLMREGDHITAESCCYVIVEGKCLIRAKHRL